MGKAFPTLALAFHWATNAARCCGRRKFVCMRDGQWWVSER